MVKATENVEELLLKIKELENRLTETEKCGMERLKESEDKCRLLMQYAPTAVYEFDYKNQRFKNVNEAMCLLSGYSKEELLSMVPGILLEKESRNRFQERIKNVLSGELIDDNVEYRVITKDGRKLWVNFNLKLNYLDSKLDSALVIGHDITQQKQIMEALVESEEKYKELVENARSIILKLDTDGRFTFINEYALKFFGYSKEELVGKKVSETIVPEIDSTGIEMSPLIKAIHENPDKYAININENIKRNGERIWIEWHNRAMFDNEGRRTGHIAIGLDITGRVMAEREVQKSKEKLEFALETGYIGIWEWNLNSDALVWDEKMRLMFGMAPETHPTLKSFKNCINEEDLPHFKEAINQTLKRNLPFETILRPKYGIGSPRHIFTRAIIKRDINGKPVSLAGVCFDVTSLRKGTEKALMKLNEDLLRSNKDLEQFAYVASHDLQEPLRMVSSFTQLLERRYNDKLDDEAKEYIRFAVDGSKHMYKLLNGLLAYSRIQSKGQEFTKIHMNDVLEKIKQSLSLKIAESKAILNVRKLPVLFADESQMIQLFQNLIGNCLKFTKKIPVITISSKANSDCYIFSIKDNGIGIESQYFDRIFRIFQRLHSREDYEGTGIGLAICKRIVERHGGDIWLESKPGKGSTFFFSIPKIPIRIEQ